MPSPDQKTYLDLSRRNSVQKGHSSFHSLFLGFFIVLLFSDCSNIYSQTGQQSTFFSTEIIKSGGDYSTVPSPSYQPSHPRHMLYMNACQWFLNVTPNIHYEFFKNDRKSINICIKYKLPNVLLDIFAFGGTWSISQEYLGPGADFGIRRYSQNQKLYLELNSGFSYLEIRNTEIAIQPHGDYVGDKQMIFSSDRYDFDLKIMAGLQTRKQTKPKPTYGFYLRSIFVSAGLRYTAVSTNIGPVYFSNNSGQDVSMKCVASQPAFLFSKDLIPNGSYLLPIIQIGLIYGVPF